MARNLKLFFDQDGAPRARGPASEKLLMAFLEADVQGSDYICHDLMNDITSIEDKSAESREFIGNAHSVVISADGVTIERNIDTDDDDNSASSENSEDNSAVENKVAAAATTEDPTKYQTGLKHFREILEDWEAFILDDQSPA